VNCCLPAECLKGTMVNVEMIEFYSCIFNVYKMLCRRFIKCSVFSIKCIAFAHKFSCKNISVSSCFYFEIVDDDNQWRDVKGRCFTSNIECFPYDLYSKIVRRFNVKSL